MILKKVHFPIFILIIVVFLAVLSCQKEKQIKAKQKKNIEYFAFLDSAEKHFKNQEFDSAFYYYNKSKLACNETKDNDKIIYSLLKMAIIQQAQADYSGSETSATEAITYFKSNTNSYYKCGVFNVLAVNYKHLFDFDNAIYYYNQAYNLAEDELQKEAIKNNIAVLNMNKRDYQRTIQILLPLTQKKKSLNNDQNYARILDNLGYSYYKVGNIKGLDYMNQSLIIKKQIKDDFGMVASYIHLSEYYKKSNPSLAYDYALSAHKKATKVNNTDDRLESLEQLIQNSSGNESKAYSEKYIHINDSIKKVRQKARNQFAKIKYDSKQDKEENLRLKTQKTETALELEQQKNRNLILYFLILIGILSTIFLYYFLKAINKEEKIQTSYDTETRIAKKLHDELANDVYHTMAFAETQDLSSNQNKEILLNNLDTIYSRTRNISKENSIIDTSTKFVEGLKEMMSGFNTDAVNILINGMDSVNWNALERNKKIIIYRVIQELLVNMKKHSQCSLAVISFNKKEKKLQIDYSDNGIGAAFDKINSRNGLQNVENRILAIKGTITFDTKPDKGFKTNFTIPI
jgi:signal transduction histidine kinase